MSAAERLRRALLASMNRHWLARLVVASWVLHLPLLAFLAPASLLARGTVQSGVMGSVMMALLAGLASVALIDSAINDLLPERFTSTLMAHRHIGFMSMAIALVVLGAAMAIKTGEHLVLATFLLPAFFAVAITWLDLHSRAKK